MRERIEHEEILKIAEAYLAAPEYTSDPATYPFLPEVLHLSRAYLDAWELLRRLVAEGYVSRLPDDLQAEVQRVVPVWIRHEARGAPVRFQEGANE